MKTTKLCMKIRQRMYGVSCLLFAAGLLMLGSSCGGDQKTVPPEPDPLTLVPSTPEPSASEPSTPEPSEPEPALPVSTPLDGTKWKLVGI